MSKLKNDEMRGLHLRGDIWWLRLPMVNGVRPPRITLETDDAAEAIRRANEIRDDPTLTESRSLVAEIENCAGYKLRMREWTANSVESKKAVLLAFAHKHSEIGSVASITTATLQKYHDRLLRKLAAPTVNGYMQTFRSFFNWAVDAAKLLRRSPMVGVRVVKTTSKGREDFASFEVRDKLIKEAPDDDLRFILYMGFHAGLRKNEIIEARPFWFDLEAGMLNLRKTATINFKDGEERSIPLTHDFAKFMRHYGLREPFVLHPEKVKVRGKRGKLGKYRYDFRRPFEDYMKAQGCEWLTAHIMRHTFASLLASSGVSIFKIAVWLGDDVKTVQKHYAKLMPADKDIERAFGSRRQSVAAGGAA